MQLYNNQTYVVISGFLKTQGGKAQPGSGSDHSQTAPPAGGVGNARLAQLHLECPPKAHVLGTQSLGWHHRQAAETEKWNLVGGPWVIRGLPLRRAPPLFCSLAGTEVSGLLHCLPTPCHCPPVPSSEDLANLALKSPKL